jgi:hypothetical protein
VSTKRQGIPEYDKASLDEPLFVLRAQDIIAPTIVELYALHCAGARVNQEKVDRVRRAARAMRMWQQMHGARLPD